jgi:hypothetical protein
MPGWIDNKIEELKDCGVRHAVFGEITAERTYQDSKWGGKPHDDTQLPEDWQKYIIEYAGGTGRASTYEFRKRMVKVAALAVAAIESLDRKTGKEPAVVK